jgi:hypothetical protein
MLYIVHSTITDEPINHGVETSGSGIVTSVVFGEAPGLQALPVAYICVYLVNATILEIANPFPDV